MTTLPTFFIPHGGGPCFFMEWTRGPTDTWHKTAAWLRSLASTLPERPKAILVISGHWEEPAFTVSTAAKPEMIFDYYGFPQHTYELDYPAPGSPALAARVVSLLQAAGLPAGVDSDRGFDHGVFVPFLVAFPDADIPVIPLSMKTDMSPEEHMAAGRALSVLRDEGVLIVGSGMSYHNMRGFNTPGGTEPSERFDSWLTDAVEAEETGDRWAKLSNWTDGAAARLVHPREEHLMPLMVAAGAAANEVGRKIFSDQVMMVTISAYRFG
jgi:aromatic ring-opening dioxygenase catalytic subunit (LigB family)